METCYKLRMNMKSELTSMIYANPVVSDIIHDRCRTWVRYIIKNIYENNFIKNFIMRALSQFNTLEAFTTFVDNTLSDTKFDEPTKEAKKAALVERYQYINNAAVMLSDAFIYDLFFILYLKGGMAIRYVCMIINTLADKVLYTPENMLENLGKVSDYDFNIAINPVLEKAMYTELSQLLSTCVNESLAFIVNTDGFFRDTIVVREMYGMVNALYEKFQLINCGVENPGQSVGNSSFVQVDKFSLSRLMIRVDITCQAPICIKERQFGGPVPKNKTSVLGELIDISYPAYDNMLEKKHAWKYANDAIFIRQCDINTSVCSLPDARARMQIDGTVIRLYTLDDIIDDITITIGDSIRMGDLSKVEKRKKRLVFLNELMCRFILVSKRHLGYSSASRITEDELTNICQTTIKSHLCTDEYIDDRVSMYIAGLGVDLKVDNYLVYILCGRFIEDLSRRGYFSELQIQTYVTNIVLQRFQEYINSLSELQLENGKKYMCSLLINAVSLHFSLNDNYISSYIPFLFLKTIVDIMNGDASTVKDFTLRVVTEMETISSTQTRPFIKQHVEQILSSLVESYSKAPFQSNICIRGGVACHLNVCNGNTACINSNDIDINLFAPEPILLQNFLDRLQPLLDAFQAKSGVVFTYNLLPNPTRADVVLFQLLAEYDNPSVQSMILEVPTGNLLPKVKHHIIEINIFNEAYAQPDKWINMTQSGNTSLSFLSGQELAKEFNVILTESLHWYRKSKYARRIAALNGMMSSPEVYRLYESEFVVQ